MAICSNGISIITAGLKEPHDRADGTGLQCPFRKPSTAELIPRGVLCEQFLGESCMERAGEHGAVETARRLILQDKVPDGFSKAVGVASTGPHVGSLRPRQPAVPDAETLAAATRGWPAS